MEEKLKSIRAMPKDEASKRIDELRKIIEEHRYNYHVLNKSTMPDAELDLLKWELDKLEEKYPDLIVEWSPTQRIPKAHSPFFGKYKKNFLKPVRHPGRMLSLRDIYTETELREWAKSIEQFVSPKEK